MWLEEASIKPPFPRAVSEVRTNFLSHMVIFYLVPYKQLVDSIA